MLVILLAIGQVCLTSAFSCSEPFKNVTALVYKDAKSNYTLTTLQNYREDIRGIYKVETEPINKIPKLCKNSISDFPELSALSLIYNGIESIDPGTFNNLPALKILNLNYNKLQVITSGVFNKLALSELHLSGNKIYSIESGTFNDLPQLEILDLSFNYVQLIDVQWFKNSHKINRLNLVYNLIKQLPENSFGNLAGLQQKISFWFLNNSISTIHKDAFKGVKNVGKLWLGSNKLRYLDDAVFSDVKQIDSIHLENNEMFCLSDKLLNNTRANEIYLSGNPLLCNCLVKLEEWGVQTNTKTYSGKKNLDKCGYKSKHQESTTKPPERIAVDL